MSIDTEIKGSPASIEAAAAWLRHTLARAVEGGADAMADSARTADGEWRGRTGDAFVGAMRRGTRAVDAGHQTTRDVASTFSDYADELGRLQGRMAALRDDARAAGLRVNGYVIESPGSGPPHPGRPPAEASPAHDADVAAYERHQALVVDFNRLAERAEEVWADVERAWERVAAKDRALDAANWTFVLTDVAGGLAGAVASYNASALRGSAELFRAHAEQNLARLRSMQGYPSQFAQRFYDDLAHYDDLARTSADDLARASRLGRLGTLGPLGVGGVLTGVGIWYDVEHGGESIEQAAASNVGGFAASVAAGAAVGTVVGGPVGTVAGVIVGAGVGVFTSGMIDGLWDHDGDVGDAFMAGVDTLADTGGALLDGASDVGGAIVDGIGGLFD